MQPFFYPAVVGAACGVVAYVILRWVFPELAPGSYVNVVGLVGVAGAGSTKLLMGIARRRGEQSSSDAHR